MCQQHSISIHISATNILKLINTKVFLSKQLNSLADISDFS